MAANLNDFKTSKKDCILSKSNFSFAEVHRVIYRIRPLHTMPDKFENATLLLRLGLPSTLQRTYPHKKICENGTF